MSLERKLRNLTLIESWYESEVTGRTLQSLFSDAMPDNVFSYIYVSIRQNPQNATQEQTETYNYYNVGSPVGDIADYFNTKFSLNYFAYNFNSLDQYMQLKTRIQSIYLTNKYKYMKLIEALGYRYNPLYNVDGTELYSRAESIGDATQIRTPKGKVITTSGTKNNNVIGDSETVYYKNPYDNNSENATVVDNKTKTNAVTTEQEYSSDYTETNDYNNVPAYKYKFDETEQKWIQDGVFTVGAKDNAFGEGFSGPERYYAEKRIRQGNIGVTKSTELLRDQREIVKFNILDEFFKDLEKEIVVGIYD